MNRTLTPRDAYAEPRNAFDHGVSSPSTNTGSVPYTDSVSAYVTRPCIAEPQVQPLLDRALRHHARPAGLRADEDRDRVQRRVARDADRRLDLGEAARRGLGRVGGEQRRVLLQVRDVRLVRGRPPRAQLLQREHQLDRVEHARSTRASRAGVRPRERRTSSARGTSTSTSRRAISSSASAAASRGDVEVDPVPRDEVVERVPVRLAPAVELDDAAVLDDERRLGIVRAVHRDEPELGERLDRAPRAGARAPRARRTAAEPLVRRKEPSLARRRRAASRTNAAVAGASQLVEPLGPRLELGRRRAARPQRGVDLEDRLVRQRRELGRAQQVVGELRPAGRARDLGLQAQRLRRRAQLRRVDAGDRRAPARRARCPPGVVTRSGRSAPSG